MIEAAADLPSDIEQVPDGKSFFAGQHGGDAVALDVFHGGAELAVDFSRAGNGVRLEWLSTLVVSASSSRHFCSSAARSPKADNWIAFKATVWLVCGSFAL